MAVFCASGRRVCLPAAPKGLLKGGFMHFHGLAEAEALSGVFLLGRSVEELAVDFLALAIEHCHLRADHVVGSRVAICARSSTAVFIEVIEGFFARLNLRIE